MAHFKPFPAQISYRYFAELARVSANKRESRKKIFAAFPRGDPVRIQTWNLLIRSQMLYSVELRGHPFPPRPKRRREGGKGNGKLFFDKIIRVISLKIIGFFINGTFNIPSFTSFTAFAPLPKITTLRLPGFCMGDNHSITSTWINTSYFSACWRDSPCRHSLNPKTLKPSPLKMEWNSW